MKKIIFLRNYSKELLEDYMEIFPQAIITYVGGEPKYILVHHYEKRKEIEIVPDFFLDEYKDEILFDNTTDKTIVYVYGKEMTFFEYCKQLSNENF